MRSLQVTGSRGQKTPPPIPAPRAHRPGVFALLVPAFCVGNEESIQTQPKHPRTLIKSMNALPSELLKSVQHFEPGPSSEGPRSNAAASRNRQVPHRVSGIRSPSNRPSWWSRTGSNRRPPACKAGALPTELRPLVPRNPCPRPEARPPETPAPLTSDFWLLNGGSGWIRTIDPRLIKTVL